MKVILSNNGGFYNTRVVLRHSVWDNVTIGCWLNSPGPEEFNYESVDTIRDDIVLHLENETTEQK